MKKSLKIVRLPLLIFSIFVASIIIFVSWILYSSFKDNYRTIKEQSYSIIVQQTIDDIETTLQNGKKLERFYGMDKIFKGVTDILSSDVKLAITDPTSKVLYSTFKNDEDADIYTNILSDKQIRDLSYSDTYTRDSETIDVQGYTVIIHPIYNEKAYRVGNMVLMYDFYHVSTELYSTSNTAFIQAGCIIFAVIFILAIYFFCCRSKIQDDNEFDSIEQRKANAKRKNLFLFIIPVTVILSSLLVQGVLAYSLYREKYQSVMFEGARDIATHITNTVNDLHEKGVPYNALNGLSDFLTNKVETASILWNIGVYDSLANTSDMLARGDEYSIINQIGDPENSLYNMKLDVQLSEAYINQQMLNLTLILLATFAVSLLLFWELSKLPDSLFFRKSKSFNTPTELQYDKATAMIRLTSFITYTGIYLSTPYSSLIIQSWNKSVFGLSVSVLASIPLTIEFLATAITPILFTSLLQKISVKSRSISAYAILIASNILCLTTSSTIVLIAARFLAGVGMAIIKDVFNSIVLCSSNTEEKSTENFAELNAGGLGGSTCGSALGGIIVSALGMSIIYSFTLFFLGLAFAVCLYITPWKLINKNSKTQTNTETSTEKTSSMRSILNLSILRFLVLFVVPLRFGMAFVTAYFPMFVQRKGLANITTSYGYLFNGLVGIYAGPVLTKALSKKLKKGSCIIISLSVAAASMLVLNLPFPLAMILLSVSLLGIFDGFGNPVCTDYYITIPAIKAMPTSNALAILGTFSSIVTTTSPIVYNIVLTLGTFGTNIIGIAILLMTFIFVFSERFTNGIRSAKNSAKKKITQHRYASGKRRHYRGRHYK